MVVGLKNSVVRMKFISFCWFYVTVAILFCHVELSYSRPFFSLDAEDADMAPSTDEVMVRRLGAVSLPASLWPVPQRRPQGTPLTSLFSNSMSAYELVWLPGGAVKILPRNINH